MLVSGYPSIDMHCILLLVKFDGGLFTSVLRNRQLFEKNAVQNGGQSNSSAFFILQTPPFEERTDLEKSLTFFEVHFSCEQDGQRHFKFDRYLEGLFIY
jgi:hypothetical protein